MSGEERREPEGACHHRSERMQEPWLGSTVVEERRGARKGGRKDTGSASFVGPAERRQREPLTVDVVVAE